MQKNLLLILILPIITIAACNQKKISMENPNADGEMISLSKEELKDKIKGGWAGQVIGCTYGGPTEFQFNGTMIGDHVPIPWDEHQMQWWYENAPGLYDDVYMDLTFVQVFEDHGLDAPAELHALAFANAEYPLWHANQAARYNILNGIMPPASGHWKNNPHADDLDFQIEADFAGLMSPGMINSSSEITDKIGHIMNYGNGWYGGVFVAAMYTQAFVSNDIQFVIREALKSLPPESRYYQTIADVLKWHEMYPDDWKQTWFELQKKWTAEKGCPDGVFKAFNIDASINGAYIALGLLYGQGDYGKTIDISTRAGYDSDCNPANAAGILGTMLGYSNIPDYWKLGIDKVEDQRFVFTDLSLLNVYEVGFKHALAMIERNGGKINENDVEIKYQAVVPVRFEESFAGIYPVRRIHSAWNHYWRGSDKEKSIFTTTFRGSGIVATGSVAKTNPDLPEYNLTIDVYLNDELMETVMMPTNFTVRKHDIYWNYDLPEQDYTIKLVSNDFPAGYQLTVQSLVVYSSTEPANKTY